MKDLLQHPKQCVPYGIEENIKKNTRSPTLALVVDGETTFQVSGDDSVFF